MRSIDDCEIRHGSDTSVAGWKQVMFSRPMAGVPSVVIRAADDSNSILKVRNVTAQGFEYMVSVIATTFNARCTGTNVITITLSIANAANAPINYIAILDNGGKKKYV